MLDCTEEGLSFEARAALGLWEQKSDLEFSFPNFAKPPGSASAGSGLTPLPSISVAKVPSSASGSS